MALENAVCGTELERVEDRDQQLRRGIVQAVVMASHVGLRTHFLSLETERLAMVEAELAARLAGLRITVMKVAGAARTLQHQQEGLTSQAGLLTQLPLLRDYQQTRQRLQQEREGNTARQLVLGNWWEGLHRCNEI